MSLLFIQEVTEDTCKWFARKREAVVVKEEAQKEQNRNIKISETHGGARDKGEEKVGENSETNLLYQSSKKLHCKY